MAAQTFGEASTRAAFTNHFRKPMEIQTGFQSAQNNGEPTDQQIPSETLISNHKMLGESIGKFRKIVGLTPMEPDLHCFCQLVIPLHNIPFISSIFRINQIKSTLLIF